MNWLTPILTNGKTIIGAVLTLAASIGGALTPEDAATIQALLHGSNTAGQIVMALGLLHKLYKAVSAEQAAQG